MKDVIKSKIKKLKCYKVYVSIKYSILSDLRKKSDFLFAIGENYKYLIGKISFQLTRNNYEFYASLFKNLDGIDDVTIIDVGANQGWFVSIIKRFISPKMRYQIYMYEPLSSSANYLFPLVDKNCVYLQKGVGNKNEFMEITEYENSGLSSILEFMGGYGIDKNSNKIVNKERIELETLDSRFNNENFSHIILKIDIQGYEYQALQGAIGLLVSRKIKFISIELSTVESYKDQKTAAEIIAFLSEYDFEIFNIYNTWKDDSGKLTEFDAIFRLKHEKNI